MRRRETCLALVSAGLLCAATPMAAAQSTSRASVDSSGVEGNGESHSPAISGDGRFVAFDSLATNLVPGDLNGVRDVFLHDRQTGTTKRVSVDSSGLEGDGRSGSPAISQDGRFVVFVSLADNLVSGDTNTEDDVFVHDCLTGCTTLVSVDSFGVQANGGCGVVAGAVSADGCVVCFGSSATNLVASDTNGVNDVFVHDRQTGSTTRVSLRSSGAQGNGSSPVGVISGDGRFVALISVATNLVARDNNGSMDVFVHDRQTARTRRVSVDSAGGEGNSDSHHPSISSEGRLVSFESWSDNLDSGDQNRSQDVFVHDRQTSMTTRVSVDSSGQEGDDNSGRPAISGDGRLVTFVSLASNLVPGDTNGDLDIFVRDRKAETTRRVSLDSSGGQSDSWSTGPAISTDGRFVAFESDATNLVSGDQNNYPDVFVHGPDLTLEAEPETVSAGSSLALTTWGGQPSGRAFLAAVDLNGAAIFVRIATSSFDGNGLWTVCGTVPPTLAGNVVTFLAFGIPPTGKAQATNPEVVTIE